MRGRMKERRTESLRKKSSGEEQDRGVPWHGVIPLPPIEEEKERKNERNKERKKEGDCKHMRMCKPEATVQLVRSKPWISLGQNRFDLRLMMCGSFLLLCPASLGKHARPEPVGSLREARDKQSGSSLFGFCRCNQTFETPLVTLQT